MRDVRELLRSAAEPDAPLDLTAVRARAARLNLRHRAGVGAAAVVAVAGAIGLASWAQSGDDRSVVLPPARSQAPAPEPSPTSGVRTLTVQVFFTPEGGQDGDSCSRVYSFPREVRRTPAVAAAALRELLRGPTQAEREVGAASPFGPTTADLLQSVRIADGVAYVSLRSLDINNASTSCGSSALLAQLDATLLQFPTVQRARYAVGGDPGRFYAALERVCPPDLTTPGGGCDASAFEQPEPLPSQAPPVHGGTPVAVYLAVSVDSSDSALERARAAAAEAGYEAGGGELGCDQGAVEALGLDPARSWSGVALYFVDQRTADRFVRGYPHEVVGVAQVTTFCLD